MPTTLSTVGRESGKEGAKRWPLDATSKHNESTHWGAASLASSEDTSLLLVDVVRFMSPFLARLNGSWTH